VAMNEKTEANKCIVCREDIKLRVLGNICVVCYDAIRFRKPIKLKK